jgi:hypothetical protein
MVAVNIRFRMLMKRKNGAEGHEAGQESGEPLKDVMIYASPQPKSRKSIVTHGDMHLESRYLFDFTAQCQSWRNVP